MTQQEEDFDRVLRHDGTVFHWTGDEKKPISIENTHAHNGEGQTGHVDVQRGGLRQAECVPVLIVVEKDAVPTGDCM